jgi:Rad51
MPTLHYLHETGGGRQRFVYVCSTCNCVLRVRRELKPVDDLLEALQGRCPGCGSGLEGSTECRLIAIPEDWSSIDLSPPKRAEHRPAVFRPASSFVHFSLGVRPLDALLRPLSKGRLVVLTGNAASSVAELAAFRAQLPLEKGGLDSSVVFVDGGNRSDPYLLASYAKQHGVGPAQALKRVATCRVFTMYQMTDMIARHLAPAISDYGAQMAVVSDLLGTFNEPELEEREARRLLAAMEAGLSKSKKETALMVTLPSPSKYDGVVAPWADTLVDVSTDGKNVRAELQRHPARAKAAMGFEAKALAKVVR